MKSVRNCRRKMPMPAAMGISIIAIGLAALFIAGIVSDGSSKENFYMKGKFDLVLYDETGNIKEERHLDNLIVDAGLQGVASRIAPHDGTINPSSPYNFVAVGSSNTAVTASQTALVAELPFGAGYSRMQDTLGQYSTASGNKLILSVTFPPGQATGTLRESGIFNAATGGDMLSRQTFADIQKAAGDTLTVTWTVTLSAI